SPIRATSRGSVKSANGRMQKTSVFHSGIILLRRKRMEEYKEVRLLLSKHELAKLQEMADAFHQTPEDIIGGLIADLTNSDRSNAEEEHAAAYSWWQTVYRNWGR